jgi:transcriptional regulator with GAF, ATPase, and Fis domain
MTSFGRFVGGSPEIRRLYPLAERLARSQVPVIIEGETGTGKEVLAEAIHGASPRSAGPYVVFDCTAVPASLLEADLFGYERGAFTGAFAARKGVFEQAHGGTLLIDEIGDLDIALQPKLLRAIERCEIRRLGGDAPIVVDVRILAATRRDLDRQVQADRFRDDLFHRLAVGRIELPPLRQRRGDVALLAHHFWRQLGGGDCVLASSIVARWEEERWPGNVRELRNAVARLLALGDLAHEPEGRDASLESFGRPGELPQSDDYLSAILAQRLPLPVARVRLVAEFQRRYTAQVLAEHGGNVARAASASGIGRRYFNMIRGRSQSKRS